LAEFVIEYLVVIKKSGSFCDSVETFNRLLQVDSAITVSEGSIHFHTDFACGYKIACGEIPDKDQLYFHLKFTKEFGGEPSSDDLDLFLSFLKTVRAVFRKAGGEEVTLWDDTSYHYSRLAYPAIYEVENLMRKLIVNFMLVNVGQEWVSERSPREFKDALDRSKRDEGINQIHSADFIHLADFLLKPYSPEVKDISTLWKKIGNAKSIEEFEELSDLSPKSNWKRYFSALIPFEDDQFRKKWNELYELRCKVAHNSLITRLDFDSIVTIAAEMKTVLTEAIDKLPQVDLPLQERQFVTESIENTMNETYIPAPYLAQLNSFERETGERPTTDTMHFFTLGTTPLEWLNMAWVHFMKKLMHSPALALEQSEEIIRAFGRAERVGFRAGRLTLAVPEELTGYLTERVCKHALYLLNDMIPRGLPFKSMEIISKEDGIAS